MDIRLFLAQQAERDAIKAQFNCREARALRRLDALTSISEPARRKMRGRIRDLIFEARREAYAALRETHRAARAEAKAVVNQGSALAHAASQ